MDSFYDDPPQMVDEVARIGLSGAVKFITFAEEMSEMNLSKYSCYNSDWLL